MAGNGQPQSSSFVFGCSEGEVAMQLKKVQQLVAQPIPQSDPNPSLVGDNLFVGNKHHAANVKQLLSLGVTAVLNCAPSGIRNLPVDAYEANGIRYAFTNVAQDAHDYPILHSADGTTSEHLNVAKAFYNAVHAEGGKALFFCVAGQNRSATLAVAVQVARGQSLEQILGLCSKSRPFMLENVGFQKQLVQLESMVRRSLMARAPSLEERAALQERSSRAVCGEKRPSASSSSEGARDGGADWRGTAKRPRLVHGTEAHQGSVSMDSSTVEAEAEAMESECMVELLVPGVRAFNVTIASSCTIDDVRQVVVDRVNAHFADHAAIVANASSSVGYRGCTIGKAWLLFNTFGSANASECGLILEEAAVDAPTQLSRLEKLFGLSLLGSAQENPSSCRVRWDSSAAGCRFELVIFSVVHPPLTSVGTPSSFDASLSAPCEVPFTFTHKERQNAPGTLLSENIIQPYLRAWDFVTGEAFRSTRPIVFSFSEDPKSRRDFMNISTSRKGEFQQFKEPGEGGILGMGNNAIVHQVQLESVQMRLASDQAMRTNAPVSLRSGRANRSREDRKSSDGVDHGSSGAVVRAAHGVAIATMRRSSSMPTLRPLNLGQRDTSKASSRRELTLPSLASRTESSDSFGHTSSSSSSRARRWEAAVKRPFSLEKMLAAIENKNEAGVAKRLRMAGALNTTGRLLYFYGLGIALSSNNNNHDE